MQNDYGFFVFFFLNGDFCYENPYEVYEVFCFGFFFFLKNELALFIFRKNDWFCKRTMALNYGVLKMGWLQEFFWKKEILLIFLLFLFFFLCFFFYFDFLFLFFGRVSNMYELGSVLNKGKGLKVALEPYTSN